MHESRFLLLILFRLLLLAVCGAASPQSISSQDASLPSNLTYPPFSPASLNVSAAGRYYIPDTQLAIDFWHQSPSIPREDVLMCIIEALSKIFGSPPSEMIPGLSTFFYKHDAFIHIQDLNPTAGRPHTYQDMASTLRGVGEYMTAFNRFWTTEFQVWEMTPTSELKIGSGGVGGKIRGSQQEGADDASSTGEAAGVEVPACDRGDQHCVA